MKAYAGMYISKPKKAHVQKQDWDGVLLWQQN